MAVTQSSPSSSAFTAPLSTCVRLTVCPRGHCTVSSTVLRQQPLQQDSPLLLTQRFFVHKKVTTLIPHGNTGDLGDSEFLAAA